MEVLVLDTNFESVGILDTYISCIWTDRYDQFGDFEIHTPSDKAILDLLQPNRYLWMKESDHVMIIEGYETSTSVLEGNSILFTGRSLESILDRRIVWSQTNFDGNLQEAIKQLLDDAIINPTDPDRKIDNFIFEESTDERITKLTLQAQYTGDNLYETIMAICAEHDLGFKITLNNDNQFVFKLYLGIDRSYDQDENVYVVFSPNYENIIESSYLESLKTLKNVTLVGGEGEGAERKTTTVGSGSGLDRRELFTDARDISTKTEDNVELSPADYTAALAQRGKEKLAENKTTKTFEGEMDTSQMYIYGEDFALGDIVQIKNEFKIERCARIIEMIYSKNNTEDTKYPTFEIVDPEENKEETE